MRDRLALRLLQLLSHTPLGFNQWLGRLLGRLVWPLAKKNRHIALTNLGLCFPEKTPAEREVLGMQSTRAMLETLLESPVLWKLPSPRIARLCLNPESFDVLHTAFDRGNGLIVAVPHLGSWEYVGLYLGMTFPTTSLYRPPRMQSIDRLMRAGRSHTGATLVPTAASGIKQMTRALQKNECIGLLPDQEAGKGNGVFADFFKQPAYTMHLLPRMAQRRHSPVYFVVATREPGGKFRFHLRQADDGIYADDKETACTSMNRMVETMVRVRPQQYNWSYKRFKLSPDGTDRY